MESFKLNIEECFILSNGMTALCGKIIPENYPIITSDKYVIEIKCKSGKSLLLNNINEDIFVSSNPDRDYSVRSMQTSDDISSFVENIKVDPIYLQGYPK